MFNKLRHAQFEISVGEGFGKAVVLCVYGVVLLVVIEAVHLLGHIGIVTPPCLGRVSVRKQVHHIPEQEN